MAQLSEHFSEEEFGIEYADQRVKDNYKSLCLEVLEPIRAHYNDTMHITSGWRPPAKNASVGGKKTSYHLADGGKSAADFHVNGIPVTKTFHWLTTESEIRFDKAILEYKGDSPSIIHVQLDRTTPCRRLAYIGQTGNGTQYTPVPVTPIPEGK